MIICILTLGCKVNQYESDGLMTVLERMGHIVKNTLAYADIYIINTCAVTAEAEKKSRHMISRARKYNADARIMICGCAAESNALQFQNKGATYITGSANKAEIIYKLEKCGCEILPLAKEYEDNFEMTPCRAKTFIKIQDGCNNFCSYCIIPYLRGRSRSRSIEAIVAEISNAATLEVILTGINISDYLPMNGGLCELIKSLKNVDKRIRLGSLEVSIINREILEALRELKQFCPHFHLSMQSGSNSVLKKMNRHYTREQFLMATKLIREYFEDAAITTDIIIGFMESDEEFLDTLDIVHKVNFADINIFPYSERKGTAAYGKELVKGEIINSRFNVLNEIKIEARKAFAESYIGTKLKVLFEEKIGNYSAGYSDNYIRVYADNSIEPFTVQEVLGLIFHKDGLLAKKV